MTPPEPGFYYRDGLRAWVRVADPREAPDGVRVWRADELTVEDGMVRPKVCRSKLLNGPTEGV